MLNTFDQIKNKVLDSGKKFRILLWDADEIRWLTVLSDLQKQGLIEATLLGDGKLIEKSASEAGAGIGDFLIENSLSISEGLDKIKTHLNDNNIDILIRGNIGVKDSLKALLKKDTSFRSGKAVVSSVSCHYVKDIDRMLVLSDPVVNPVPDLNRKIAIVNNAVSYAHKLEDDLPRVAMLAAVEVVYPVMPHTLEGAVIAKMNDRGQIKGCLVDGPLSMDVAVIEMAARGKGVKGEVAGNANVLIAPNIETAYGMYKAFVIFVGAPSGCFVTGGRIPYVVTSRSDSIETKQNSLLMAML